MPHSKGHGRAHGHAHKPGGDGGASSNYITNGTFDTDTGWTKGTGWTISGGKANDANTGEDFSQSISIPVGNYTLSFTATNPSGATFAMQAGDGFGGQTLYLGAGNGPITATPLAFVTPKTTFTITGDGSATAYSIDNLSITLV